MENEWEEKFDPKSQRKFWKNKSTGKSQWTDPFSSKDGEKEIMTATTSANASLEEWVEKFDVKSQRKYWKNITTGKTTWNNPTIGKTTDNNNAAEEPVSTLATVRSSAESSEWVEKFDSKSQRKYWKNKTTGKTTWNDPTPDSKNIASAQISEVKSASVATPVLSAESSEWVEKFDAKSQRKYWKNKTTGKTTWNDPTPDMSSLPSVVEGSSNEAIQTSVLGSTSDAALELGEWEEKVDVKTNRKYWKNKITKKSSWTDPYAVAKSTVVVEAPSLTIVERPAPVHVNSEIVTSSSNSKSTPKLSKLVQPVEAIQEQKFCPSKYIVLLLEEDNVADVLKLTISLKSANCYTLSLSPIVDVEPIVIPLSYIKRIVQNDDVGRISFYYSEEVMTFLCISSKDATAISAKIKQLNPAIELVSPDERLTVSSVNENFDNFVQAFYPISFQVLSDLSLWLLDGTNVAPSGDPSLIRIFLNNHQDIGEFLPMKITKAASKDQDDELEMWQNRWISFSVEERLISVHKFGPNTPKSFAISFMNSSAYLLNSYERVELELRGCRLNEASCSVNIRFRRFLDLVTFVAGFLPGGQLFGSVTEALQSNVMIDSDKWLALIALPRQSAAGSENATYSRILSVVDLLVHASLRRIVKSHLRCVSITGQDLHSLKLQTLNNRIIVSSHGTTNISEGSVVLCVNSVSPLLTAGHTMLKLMSDIPPSLPVELAIFKQPIVFTKRAYVKFVRNEKKKVEVKSSGTAVRRLSNFIASEADASSTTFDMINLLAGKKGLKKEAPQPVVLSVDNVDSIPWETCELMIKQGSIIVRSFSKKEVTIQLFLSVIKILIPVANSGDDSKYIGIEIADPNDQFIVKFTKKKECISFLMATMEALMLTSTPLSHIKAMYDQAVMMIAESYNDTTKHTENVDKDVSTSSIASALSIADELEGILTSLGIPSAFPSLSIIRALNDDLAHMNSENHMMLKDFLRISSGNSEYASIEDREAKKPSNISDSLTNVGTAVPFSTALPLVDQHKDSSFLDLEIISPSRRSSQKINPAPSRTKSIIAALVGVSEPDRDICSQIVSRIRSDSKLASAMSVMLDRDELYELTRIYLWHLFPLCSTDFYTIQRLFETVATDDKNLKLTKHSTGERFLDIFIEEAFQLIEIMGFIRIVCELAFEKLSVNKTVLTLEEIADSTVEQICSAFVSMTTSAQVPCLIVAVFKALQAAESRLSANSVMCTHVVPRVVQICVELNSQRETDRSEEQSSSIAFADKMRDLLNSIFGSNPVVDPARSIINSATYSRSRWLAGRFYNYCFDLPVETVSSIPSPIDELFKANAGGKPACMTDTVCLKIGDMLFLGKAFLLSMDTKDTVMDVPVHIFDSVVSRLEESIIKNPREVLLLGGRASSDTVDLLRVDDDSHGAAEVFGVAWLVNAIRSTLKRLKCGNDLSVSEVTVKELLGLRERLRAQTSSIALIMQSLRRFEGYKEILRQHRTQISALIDRDKSDSVFAMKTEVEFLQTLSHISLRTQRLELESISQSSSVPSKGQAFLKFEGISRLQRLSLSMSGDQPISPSNQKASSTTESGGKHTLSRSVIGASPLKILMQNLFQPSSSPPY